MSLRYRYGHTAALSNFRWKARGSTDARALVDDPAVTLYCLDSFYYQGQFRNALRLLTVSYEILHELADYAGRQFANLILPYSVGRCGSTLLSKAFHRVDTVLDLSELDVYMQITAMRPGDGSRDEELKRQLESCTRVLCKPTGPQTTLAIKFRSFSIQIADLLYQLCPAAKVLFLYRNAESWAQSRAKAFDIFSDQSKEMMRKNAGREPAISAADDPAGGRFSEASCTPAVEGKGLGPAGVTGVGEPCLAVRGRVMTPAEYLEPHFRSFPSAKLMAVQWLSVMGRCLGLSGQGIPMLAIRSESMVAEPRRVLEAIFEFCGLPREQLAAAEAVFAEDSQMGTILARRGESRPRGAYRRRPFAGARDPARTSVDPTARFHGSQYGKGLSYGQGSVLWASRPRAHQSLAAGGC